jgi:hypothetical protein
MVDFDRPIACTVRKVAAELATVSMRGADSQLVEDRRWTDVLVELLAGAFPWRTFRWSLRHCPSGKSPSFRLAAGGTEYLVVAAC